MRENRFEREGGIYGRKDGEGKGGWSVCLCVSVCLWLWGVIV